MQRRVELVVWIVPALALLPLLTTPVPVTIHGPREIAGYFQALALARIGLESYFLLTPQESFSALHLHSLLIAPLVALGYVEGGRLVSLLAAIGSVAGAGYVGSQLADQRSALLAPAVLWAQPVFVRHAWVFEPDTLSISLTTGAVACVLRYLDTEDRRWFVGSAAMLVLGITNRMWEATIVLPLVVALLWEGRRREALWMALLAPLTAALVSFVTELQPSGASTLLVHSTRQTGLGIFLRPRFWTAHLDLHYGLPAPYGLGLTLLLPLSVGACLYWAIRARRTGELRVAVLAAWLASGLAIPLMLARGYLIHYYYLWALLAPFAVTVALVGNDAIDWIGATADQSPDRIRSTVVAILVVGALTHALVFQAGALGGTTLPVVQHVDSEQYKSSDATEAGVTLRTLDPRHVASLFVGSWEQDFTRDTGRVAVYSGILFRQRIVGAPGGPDLVTTLETVTPCEAQQASDHVVVQKANGTISVHDCRSTG
ncbi:ArnT family glycosyltransferase [Haloarcula halophila]|uniref:ArnT family glycosyltransferase n=1 Tax=Haloarcula TaxID=2237 RepID=UPI0023E40A61|nr:glycosyltransferase family 39 protein [Halomicroarcula sp. DFY41]